MGRLVLMTVVLGLLSSACSSGGTGETEAPFLIEEEGEEVILQGGREDFSLREQRILSLLTDAVFSFEGSSLKTLHFLEGNAVEAVFGLQDNDSEPANASVSLPENFQVPLAGLFEIKTVFGGLIQIVMDFPNFKLIAVLGDEDGRTLIVITSEGEVIGYRVEEEEEEEEVSDIPAWIPPSDPEPEATSEIQEPEVLPEGPSDVQEPEVTEPPLPSPDEEEPSPPPSQKPKKDNPGKGKGRS